MSVFNDINTDLDLNGPFLAFTTQPSDSTVDEGANVVLSVVVSKTFTDNPSPTDSGTLIYEWFERIPNKITLDSPDPLIDYVSLVGSARGRDNMGGESTDTLILYNAQRPYDTADFSNDFKCKVTYQPKDRYASGTIIKGTGPGRNEPIISDAATITVNPKIRIVTNPGDQVVLENQNAVYEIVASISPTVIDTTGLTYKWYFVNNDGGLTEIQNSTYTEQEGTTSQTIEYVDGVATSVIEDFEVSENFSSTGGNHTISADATDIRFTLAGGQGGSGGSSSQTNYIYDPAGPSYGGSVWVPYTTTSPGGAGGSGRYGIFKPATGKEDEFRGKTFTFSPANTGGGGKQGKSGSSFGYGGGGLASGGRGGQSSANKYTAPDGDVHTRQGLDAGGGGGGGASGFTRSDGVIMAMAAGGGGGGGAQHTFASNYSNNPPSSPPRPWGGPWGANPAKHNGVAIQPQGGGAGGDRRNIGAVPPVFSGQVQTRNDIEGGGGGGGGGGSVGSSTYGTPVSVGGAAGSLSTTPGVNGVGAVGGAGGGSGYRTDFLELITPGNNTGNGYLEIDYKYSTTTTTTTPGTAVAVPVTYTNYQYITYSGVTSSTLTVNARYVQSERPSGYFKPTRQLRCIISHPTASNSPVTVPDETNDDDGLSFTVSENLTNILYVEQISATVDDVKININGDIDTGVTNITAPLSSPLIFETLGDTDDIVNAENITLSPYLYRFYCLSDTEVNISLYGGAGVKNPGKATSGNPGKGSYTKIKVTLEADTEYVIAGLDPFVNNPFIYKKARLMAAAGQGGGSSWGGQSNDGGDGKAVDTTIRTDPPFPIGGQLGGRCGYFREESNPYPGKVLFGDPSNYPNASISVFGPIGRVNPGITPTCTIGDIETLYGYSPCQDMYQQFRGHLMLPNGSQLLGTNPNLRHRGYKMGNVDGLGCLLTGGDGRYSQAGNGGNGYRGGEGGNRGFGEGGYGYIDTGLCELIESQDGVNSDVARVVIQDANIGVAPPFDYLIVAGGGGGAYQYGGGGGGGGMVQASYRPAGIDIPPNKLNIFVGSGGSGGTSTTSAQNGGNSTLYTPGGEINVTTFGGGAGGVTGAAGAGGGSGGGGGPGTGSEFASPGGAGYQSDLFDAGVINVQGLAGGQGYSGDPSYPGGGGGGGAGGLGGDKTSNFGEPGKGGDGRVSSITGSSITYAGGGGGGQFYDDSVGAVLSGGVGGTGGGGDGGIMPPSGQVGFNRYAVAGTAGLGGGGGGGGAYFAGGNGGSGVVIITFPDTFPDAQAVVTGGGRVFKFSAGGTRTYVFYGDGTLEFQ